MVQENKSFSQILSAKSTHFAVISDIHIMAPSLLIKEGKAFTNYLDHDRKMLKESPFIVKRMIDELIAAKPQFVLITGDLTKDGEYESHRFLIDNYLSKLRMNGIIPLVIPGNHDINNPDAVSFLGDNTQRVRTLKAQEFSELYTDYGYGKAIARDKHSLSYVFQLSDNLRILALDANKYKKNDFKKNFCRYDGHINSKTMKFIEEQLEDAHKNGVRVLTMMHHGLVEHWKYQNKIMHGYLVDHWKKRAKKLSKMGIDIIFTGHAHAQDISHYKKGRHSLIDVETGSAVSYPSPYRLLSIDGDTLTIKSKFIKNLPINLGDVTFPEYSKKFLITGVMTFTKDLLPKTLPDSIEKHAGGLAAQALMANYRGDAKLTPENIDEIRLVAKQIRKHSTIRWGLMYKFVVKSIWKEKETVDNDLTVRLSPIPKNERTTIINNEKRLKVPDNSIIWAQ